MADDLLPLVGFGLDRNDDSSDSGALISFKSSLISSIAHQKPSVEGFRPCHASPQKIWRKRETVQDLQNFLGQLFNIESDVHVTVAFTSFPEASTDLHKPPGKVVVSE